MIVRPIPRLSQRHIQAFANTPNVSTSHGCVQFLDTFLEKGIVNVASLSTSITLLSKDRSIGKPDSSPKMLPARSRHKIPRPTVSNFMGNNVDQRSVTSLQQFFRDTLQLIPEDAVDLGEPLLTREWCEAHV